MFPPNQPSPVRLAGLGTLVQAALVKAHLGAELIGHLSRDSTAIAGREKPVKMVKQPQVPRKKGRPAKGEEPQPLEPKRLDFQHLQSAEEAIALLPKACDRVVKKNAKGYTETWNGYKLHLDVNDIGSPISAVLTSASVHDSQVAIPLIKLTSGKEIIPMAPHEAERYNERTASERCNGRLKEDLGARNVMVRGPEKVMMHLMFGALALFADQLIKVTGC